MFNFKTKQEAEEQSIALSQELEQLNSSYSDLESEKNELLEKHTYLETKLQELETEKNGLAESLNVAKESLQEKDSRIQELESSRLENAASTASPAQGETRKTDEEIIEEFRAITDPQKRHEYYLQHRTILNPFK